MRTFDCDAAEKQLTFAEHGHILTNSAVWSPDSQWIVYDVRSDPAGDLFDSTRIERVHADTGEVQVLYESKNGAHCGVATYCPDQDRIVFIHGPEQPNDHWQYAAYHRRGVIVNTSHPGVAVNLDARDLVPPFTPGALRGGTHVHTFAGDSKWVAFTYEDHVLESQAGAPDSDRNQRNLGVSVAVRAVSVPPTHRRNHDGTHFSVLVTRTENSPEPGSDQISRAFSDAWVGTNGYVRPDGSRQAKAIAFQGDVTTLSGDTISEVFIVDIPNDVTQHDRPGMLQGTTHRRPAPPKGTIQRRLTRTDGRRYPGIQGVRHWLRSSADGSQIAFLMRDDQGVSQLWTVSPNGGDPCQVTSNQQDIESAFSWTPDGTQIAHVMGHAVCLTAVRSGATGKLTKPNLAAPLRPQACVVSPDGSQIAYLREVTSAGQSWNQVFTVAIPNTNSNPVDNHDAVDE